MENQAIAVLESCGAIITYVPLRTEVPFQNYLSLPNTEKTDLIYQISPRASLDPYDEAKKAIEFAAGRKTCVLIPGRQFDASGTRFGQGGGWYDRFLSVVPAEWTRIGFCFDHQFSEVPLVREEWDQVMDVVCVVNKDSGLQTYETRARNK